MYTTNYVKLRTNIYKDNTRNLNEKYSEYFFSFL